MCTKNMQYVEVRCSHLRLEVMHMVFNRLSTIFVDNGATPLKQQVFSFFSEASRIFLVRILLEVTLLFVVGEVGAPGFA